MSADQDRLLKVDPATGEPYLDLDCLKVHLATEEEAATCEAVICAPAERSRFADDVHTTCAHCRRAIVHRPHQPAAVPKVCIDCFVTMMQEEQEKRTAVP